ncbi:MAG: DUF5596 domain-containing protein [Actinomycetales bacterium]|nr:DUF5596 domain-containing protein [Actinomycetales bacterium]
MIDISARLGAPDLSEQLLRLGFRDEDARDALVAATTVLASPAQRQRVETLVPRLVAGIGDVTLERTANPWDDDAARGEHLGAGVLPLLAMLATVPEVRAFHRSRGIGNEVSWKSLSDLGQQVRVHRLTYGTFGLHTHAWLTNAWFGGLYWLGRLQYTVRPGGGGFVLSCHIPRTGPLPPGSVDESFATAATFFAEHFPDLPAAALHCASWLLDPQLADVLPATSNMVSFQRRWELYGEPHVGDEDVLFFVFARRGPVDLEALPRATSLERAVVDHLRHGGHWFTWDGLAALPAPTV